AYLKLGEIYYDTLKNYELSQAYYDSAISALPTDYENYASIKARQEILNEFVKHLKTVQWQDSLLTLATLDSAAIRHMADSVVTAERKLAELAESKKKKRRNRVEIETDSSKNILGNNETNEMSGDWYVGNPAAVGMGQSEFKRVWGDVKLEDNWRRSQRISGSVARSTPTNTSDTTQMATAGDQSGEAAPDADPVDV